MCRDIRRGGGRHPRPVVEPRIPRLRHNTLDVRARGVGDAGRRTGISACVAERRHRLSRPGIAGGGIGDESGTLKIVSDLHERVGMLPMAKHEFLSPDRRKQRTVFANPDGSVAASVTVDFTAETYEIEVGS